MEEGHYDTPWEFKNRAIAAALSANANCGLKFTASGGGADSMCQMKASTSSEENISCEMMLPSYYENNTNANNNHNDDNNDKRLSTVGAKTRMSSLLSKTPSPPQAGATSVAALSAAKNGGSSRSHRSSNSGGVLRTSTSNVYAEDPLAAAAAAKPTANCCAPFPAAASTAVAATQPHSRRFSTNSGGNYQKQVNLHHHYPSVCPVPQQQHQQQAQQLMRHADALPTPAHRNRHSCDEIGSGAAKKTSPSNAAALRANAGSGGVHFHAPSTASSSSTGSPFLASGERRQSPSLHFSLSPPAASAKASARDKYLETYPLVGGHGLGCCCGCDAATSGHHVKTKHSASNLSKPPRYPGGGDATQVTWTQEDACAMGGAARCFLPPSHAGSGGEENCGAGGAPNFNHHGASRRHFDEANMIHDCMERVDAERILKPLEVGDFLLRKRTEGNLALSLRSTDGILHIKLEMREGCWVLGEGPRFPTVAGVLRCYRRTELPVRGAEHVRLRAPVTRAQLGGGAQHI